MIAELGHFGLILALMIALVQGVVPLVGASKNNRNMMRFASYAAITQFAFVVLAFVALTTAFVTSDFSVRLVAQHSQSAKPLIYKISGVWANHEGSMLLWVLILTLFGAAIAATGGDLPERLKARVLAVQSMISAAFLAFIQFTSNPFIRLENPPVDGNGMNPILQDPGLALHPPCLYVGYVGFSVAFAFAVAALIEGDVSAAWARWVRPWVLVAWCFLTMGITLGSFWAYYVLGWGGWWFWDPVENVSFMPWLAGTALLHSALVVERRHTLVNWTILLAILTFSLSLVGTFVVRSGVLTSVHSFANDPERGVFILAILIAATGGALTLYALRIPGMRFGAPFAAISREASLVLNNALLVGAAGTVFLGTFYPLFIDLMGDDKISVGPPYYEMTFVPIMIPLLFVMAVGPMLRWKRDTLKNAFGRLRVPAILALLAAVLAVVWLGSRSFLTVLGLGLGAWLIAAAIAILFVRFQIASGNLRRSVQLAKNTPAHIFGLVLAHAGMGVAVVAITAVSTWQSENITTMKPGDTAEISGFTVKLRQVLRVPGPNFDSERGVFDVAVDGEMVASVSAERRFYPVQQTATTHTGIRTNLFSNLYVALGDPQADQKWTVRLYYHPMAPWIWFGGALMALGGFVSLSDRRFRVGAPVRARKRSEPAVAGA